MSTLTYTLPTLPTQLSMFETLGEVRRRGTVKRSVPRTCEARRLARLSDQVQASYQRPLPLREALETGFVVTLVTRIAGEAGGLELSGENIKRLLYRHPVLSEYDADYCTITGDFRAYRPCPDGGFRIPVWCLDSDGYIYIWGTL